MRYTCQVSEIKYLKIKNKDWKARSKMITTTHKIDINKLKIVPDIKKQEKNKLELCFYGNLPDEIKEWIEVHQIKTYKIEQYTNIIIDDHHQLSDLFNVNEPYEFMDGFSPNLNKHLHIGHFSNFVFAKAMNSLGLCKHTLSIYGDTLLGEVTKKEALDKLDFYFDNFGYHSLINTYASEMRLINDDILSDGEDNYAGCKVFNVGDQKIVGIKSDGSTSYFYQDVSLAQKLNNSRTLYLTGKEQENHFQLFKILFPNITHLPLGLVKVNSKKMGTRFGNVIYIDTLLQEIKEEIGEDASLQLIYNVFAGFILRTTPESDKNINLDSLTNVKNSPGFYISYTMARLHSAGVFDEYIADKNISTKFENKELEYLHLRSYNDLKPNLLFDGLINLCNEINHLYSNHHIRGNQKNIEMFGKLLSDLMIGCEKLGLFYITKV